MDAFDEMQERLRQRGMTHMLLPQRTAAEIADLCRNIDENFAAGETRLQIAEGKKEDKRAKKRERRAAREADVCLIVQDERRGGDRRWKRRI